MIKFTEDLLASMNKVYLSGVVIRTEKKFSVGEPNVNIYLLTNSANGNYDSHKIQAKYDESSFGQNSLLSPGSKISIEGVLKSLIVTDSLGKSFSTSVVQALSISKYENLGNVYG